MIVDRICKKGFWQCTEPECNCECLYKLAPGESFEPKPEPQSHRTMDEEYVKRELEKQPITIECAFGVQYMDLDKVQNDLQEMIKRCTEQAKAMECQCWFCRFKRFVFSMADNGL